jgi:hypothetical protein
MQRTAARVALVLLALSATLAFGGASGQPSVRANADASDASGASTAGGRDRALAVASAPTSGPEWAAPSRGPSGGDRSIAILLAVAALVVGRRWRRVDAVADRIRLALRGRGSGIRGPPAFA